MTKQPMLVWTELTASLPELRQDPELSGDDDGIGTLEWLARGYRAKVPGGWLVSWGHYKKGWLVPVGSAFLPDPDHTWDGNSLP